MKMTNEKDKDIYKNPQIFEIDILKKETKQTNKNKKLLGQR